MVERDINIHLIRESNFGVGGLLPALPPRLPKLECRLNPCGKTQTWVCFFFFWRLHPFSFGCNLQVHVPVDKSSSSYMFFFTSFLSLLFLLKPRYGTQTFLCFLPPFIQVDPTQYSHQGSHPPLSLYFSIYLLFLKLTFSHSLWSP